MAITISPLQQSEIQAAAALISEIFGAVWGERAEKEFTRLFLGEQHPTYVFTAKERDTIVGLGACLETYFAESTFGLCWLGVTPAYRRQGIAEKLVTAREQFIKNTLLQGNAGTVLVATDRVESYARMGYKLHPAPMHDGTKLMMKVI